MMRTAVYFGPGAGEGGMGCYAATMVKNKLLTANISGLIQ